MSRNKSKKGGVQKRVYFWGAISWWGKSRGVAWHASDLKVCWRHTKNLCVGTVFENDGIVFRVTESRAQGDRRTISYCEHFAFPDGTPPDHNQFETEFDEVQEWHQASRAMLAQREDLQPPTQMQDTAKTLEIYEDALYPTLLQQGINSIVEDNASPHNNQSIRDSHRRHAVNIVGYEATEAEKAEIVELIRAQTRHYKRDQDKRAQITKQTRELARLPAWPPNSPDLNLIEVVWSWMVKAIRDDDDGWPRDPETLKQRVLQAWDDIPLSSFRELVRSYRLRLRAILSVGGNRHPQFA